MLQIGNARVGNDDGGTAQLPAIFSQKGREIFAADLLLAFEHAGQVAGQSRVRFQIGFHRLEMGNVLAFVVAGPTGEERTAVDARLNRRRFPQVERVDWLNVVMAVNDKMVPRWRAAGL